MFTVDNIVVLYCDMLMPQNEDQSVGFSQNRKLEVLQGRQQVDIKACKSSEGRVPQGALNKTLPSGILKEKMKSFTWLPSAQTTMIS